MNKRVNIHKIITLINDTCDIEEMNVQNCSLRTGF